MKPRTGRVLLLLRHPSSSRRKHMLQSRIWPPLPVLPDRFKDFTRASSSLHFLYYTICPSISMTNRFVDRVVVSGSRAISSFPRYSY